MTDSDEIMRERLRKELVREAETEQRIAERAHYSFTVVK